MKKNLLFVIISMAFLFAGVDAIAQDTKHADPRYLELDEHPTFKGGGPNNFATWVTSHVKYPKAAKKAGVEGTVKVCFVVDTDGKIADAHVHESVHPLLDAEAIRVVMKSPKWKPAKKDGKPVRVSYTMPVMFYFRNLSLLLHETIDETHISDHRSFRQHIFLRYNP